MTHQNFIRHGKTLSGTPQNIISRYKTLHLCMWQNLIAHIKTLFTGKSLLHVLVSQTAKRYFTVKNIKLAHITKPDCTYQTSLAAKSLLHVHSCLYRVDWETRLGLLFGPNCISFSFSFLFIFLNTPQYGQQRLVQHADK